MHRKNSRSTIFLTEVILALTIFALCSSVCVGLLFLAHQSIEDSHNLNQAVFAAQNAAEAFQAQPEAAAVAAVLGGQVDGDSVQVYYDQDWQAGALSAEAAFVLLLSVDSGQDYLRTANITISAGEQTIYELQNAVYVSEVAR